MSDTIQNQPMKLDGTFAFGPMKGISAKAVQRLLEWANSDAARHEHRAWQIQIPFYGSLYIFLTVFRNGTSAGERVQTFILSELERSNLDLLAMWVEKSIQELSK